MEKKIVVGLSGGMDSATVLGYYLGRGCSVIACSFYYGSKHNQYENDSARKIVSFYQQRGFPVALQFFNVLQAFAPFQSNLLLSGGDIPEGHYQAESMRQTVVPGRNLILTSIMAGLAESVGASAVALGVHAGDHHIYPDCRSTFIEELRLTVSESTEGKVDIYAPFLYLNKAQILEIGYGLEPGVPYELTRTCYKHQELACGKCGSCQERLEAFTQIGRKDPIQYE